MNLSLPFLIRNFEGKGTCEREDKLPPQCMNTFLSIFRMNWRGQDINTKHRISFDELVNWRARPTKEDATSMATSVTLLLLIRAVLIFKKVLGFRAYVLLLMAIHRITAWSCGPIHPSDNLRNDPSKLLNLEKKLTRCC